MSTLAREPELITRRSKPVSVFLPIKEYHELLERLENAEEAAYLKKTRAKPLSSQPLKDNLEHA